VGRLPSPDAVERRLRQALELAELTPDRLVKALLPTMFLESASTEILDEFGASLSEFHPVGFRVMARSFAEADLHDVLPHIEVPTLLLYGDKDVRAPLNVAEATTSPVPRGLGAIPSTARQSSSPASDGNVVEHWDVLQDDPAAVSQRPHHVLTVTSPWRSVAGLLPGGQSEARSPTCRTRARDAPAARGHGALCSLDPRAKIRTGTAAATATTAWVTAVGMCATRARPTALASKRTSCTSGGPGSG
jgi:hypothetical protein